jgi:hypothetical protein
MWLYVLCIALACLIPSTWSWPVGNNHERRNFRTVSQIYNLTIYPHQLTIIEDGGAGVPPGLFNPEATGRVDPVGTFTGFEDSIEYFFALAPVPQANPASAAITSIQITEFSSACPDVAASVVYLFCSVVNPGSPDDGKPLAPLKQVSDSRVSATDARSGRSKCLTLPGSILEVRRARSGPQIRRLDPESQRLDWGFHGCPRS